MSRRASCSACTFIKNGVKTRKAIPHTCGKDDKDIRTLMENAKKEINERYQAGKLSDEKINQIGKLLDDTIVKTDKLIDEIRRNPGNSEAGN